MVMFSEEEVREMSDLKKEKDCVNVMCRYGPYSDVLGRFRVFLNDDLEISCDCTPDCQEGSFFLPLLYLCPLSTFHSRCIDC